MHTPLIIATAALLCFACQEGASHNTPDTGVANDTALEADTRPQEDTAPVALVLEPLTTLSGGEQHTCFLNELGDATCWGNNTHGQVDDSAAPDAFAPQRIGTDLARLSAGGRHTCVISTDATLRCWGANDAGQLGTTRSPVIHVAAGSRHTCALSPQGEVMCWGANDMGQLGSEDAYPSDVMALSSGGDHTCALTHSGAVYCWGSGTPTPQRVSLSGDALSVTVGDMRRCAMLSTGELQCWTQEAAPQTVETQQTLSRVSARGRAHACANTRDGGRVLCWGENTFGQLATGDEQPSELPIEVSQLRVFAKDVAAGGDHVCIFTDDDRILCWGRSDTGQMGTEPNAQTWSAPVTIALP